MWLADLTAPGIVHVTPIDDVVAHEDSWDCICGPAVERIATDRYVITHHSLDGRERHEADA